MLQSELKRVGIGASVFFATVGEILEGNLIAEHLIPVDSADDLVELSGIISRGIEAANERAHTGSGDVVHGDMVLLEPADDANVSQSEGAAAFEDKCNSRSRFRSCFLCDSRGGQECQRQ